MNKFTRFALCSGLSALVLYSATAAAQTEPLSFEVVSVKPNKSGSTNTRMTGGGPNGAVTAENATIKTIIRQAYGVQASQLIGGPDWLDVDRFDINARAEGAPTEPRLMAMLRSMLADRFKLVTHKDMRDIPVYALVLARPDGTLGPQLSRSDVDCAALGRSNTPPPPARPVPGPQGRPMGACGILVSQGIMAARSNPMDRLARTLTGSVDRMVIDKTGLTGAFDLDLSWTPDPTVDQGGASIFTALQEQLGLKLEAVRAPMEVIVIDRIEPPSPD